MFGLFTRSKGESTEQADYIDAEKVIDRDSIHSIFPFSFELFPTYVQAGENFIRVLLVADYPEKTHGNWLSELRRKKDNIHIVQYIKGSGSQGMIQHYKKTITNKEAQRIGEYDPVKVKMLEKQIESANWQLDKYLGNETAFVYQYTYIFLRADNLKELEDLTDSVKSTLVRLQLTAITPTNATSNAFWSALPIGENCLPEYTYKESNTEAASSMLPFDDGEILNLKPGSDIEGINKDTGSLIAIDREDKNLSLNPHKVIVGTSGVGKTTYMIQQILRYIAQGHKVYIIDPNNEYTPIISALGGDVLHMSSNALHKINPLQVFSEELPDIEDYKDDKPDMERLIKDKIQRVKGLFGAFKKDISPVEKAIMDSVIKKAYINRGILKYQTISEIKADQWPILEDILSEMKALEKSDPDRYERIKDLHYIVESHTTGSNSLFNGYTNVSLKSNLVSFDLKSLQSEIDVQAAAYFNVFTFLWDEMTKDRITTKRLFVDEFHFLTMNQESARFFHQGYKRLRQFKAGVIAGTQQIQDVMEGVLIDGISIGEAIVGNSYTKVFFGLDNKGVVDVIEKLHISFSGREKKLLEKRRQGEAVIMYGGQRAFMKVELTEEELRLIDPEKYMEKYLHKTAECPDYTKRVQITPRELEDIKQILASRRQPHQAAVQRMASV